MGSCACNGAWSTLWEGGGIRAILVVMGGVQPLALPSTQLPERHQGPQPDSHFGTRSLPDLLPTARGFRRVRSHKLDLSQQTHVQLEVGGQSAAGYDKFSLVDDSCQTV
jgi:hypothetical protein